MRGISVDKDFNNLITFRPTIFRKDCSGNPVIINAKSVRSETLRYPNCVLRCSTFFLESPSSKLRIDLSR